VIGKSRVERQSLKAFQYGPFKAVDYSSVSSLFN
jgi:hypothetical protein